MSKKGRTVSLTLFCSLPASQLRTAVATDYFLVFTRHRSSPSPTEQTEAAAARRRTVERRGCSVRRARARVAASGATTVVLLLRLDGGAHPTLSVRQLAVTVVVANGAFTSVYLPAPIDAVHHRPPLGFYAFLLRY